MVFSHRIKPDIFYILLFVNMYNEKTKTNKTNNVLGFLSILFLCVEQQVKCFLLLPVFTLREAHQI